MNAPDRSPKRCRNLLHPRGRLYMKLSTKPFCIGFPGAMKCQSMAASLHQASMGVNRPEALDPHSEGAGTQ